MNRVHEEALQLQDNMDKFQREIEAEVQAVLARTPYEIFGPKVPVAVDAETNDDIHSMKSLPPPLVPQSVLPVFDLTESSPGKKGRFTDCDFFWRFSPCSSRKSAKIDTYFLPHRSLEILNIFF